MIFYAILRYKLTGNDLRFEFPSEQARALCIVALGDYVTVLEEGAISETHFAHDDASGLSEAV